MLHCLSRQFLEQTSKTAVLACCRLASYPTTMKEAARSVWSIIRLPTPPGAIESSRWINEDIRPLPPSRRRWTTFTYLGWWSIWMMGLSNFQVGSSMVAIGMSVWQVMIAVILGRIIIAIMAVLNGQVGADWHIGFPVFSRVLWGMRVSSLLFAPRRIQKLPC